jgi:hypothetical protein
VPLDADNQAGIAHTYRPRRDVAAAFVLKVILLAALYLLFFSSTARPPADAEATAAAVAPGVAPRAAQ